MNPKEAKQNEILGDNEMKHTVLLLAILFVGCESRQAQIEREVNRDIPLEVEVSVIEAGFREPKCRIVGNNLVKTGPDTYRGSVACYTRHKGEVSVNFSVQDRNGEWTWIMDD